VKNALQDTQNAVVPAESGVGSDKPVGVEAVQESLHSEKETITQSDHSDSQEVVVKESQDTEQGTRTKSDQVAQKETHEPSSSVGAHEPSSSAGPAAFLDTQVSTFVPESNEANAHSSSQGVDHGTRDIHTTSGLDSPIEQSAARSSNEGVAVAEAKNQDLTGASEPLLPQSTEEKAGKDADLTSVTPSREGDGDNCSSSAEAAQSPAVVEREGAEQTIVKSSRDNASVGENQSVDAREVSQEADENTTTVTSGSHSVAEEKRASEEPLAGAGASDHQTTRDSKSGSVAEGNDQAGKEEPPADAGASDHQTTGEDGAKGVEN
jgi:hypothetical protein